MPTEREGGGEIPPFSIRDSHQAMEARIAELAQQSRFTKLSEADREILRSPEGEEFSLRRVEGSEDDALEQIHALLEKVFSFKETDPLKTLQKNAGKDHIVYYYIENAKGEVLALSQTEYLNFAVDPSSQREGLLFVVYIATDPEARSQGFATELYQKMYSFGLEKAEQSDERLAAVIGETVDAVEPFLNRMGRKRVYLEDDQGNVKEVPYILPPLDWDPKTGGPVLDSSKEHLMLRLLDGRQGLSTGELLGMVRSIYDMYIFDREYFVSEDAYENHQKHLQAYFENLSGAMKDAKGGHLFLMNAEEREVKHQELEKQEKRFIEFKSG